MLTTQQFSKASGVPCGTLRRWRSVYRGTDEGRQGVLIPVVVGSKGKPSLYAESQLDRARRLHNPNYGLKSLFEEMNDMTDETATALEVDAKAAADEVFDNGETASPVDADNTHAAQIVNARDDVQDSSGDATRNEINALLARVVELILDADDDALTVTKAGLAGIVAALKKNVARVKIDSARKTIATDGISVCNPPKEA